MSYSTIDDQKNETPEERIKELVTDENEGSLTNEVVAARVNQIISESDSELDAMLAIGGYTTPVTTPATALVLLRSWSKALTAYKMYKRKDMITDARQKEFDRINRLLEKIGQGTFRLPEAALATTGAEYGVGMSVVSHTRFTVSS